MSKSKRLNIVMREAYYIYLNSKFKTIIKKDDGELSTDNIEIIKVKKKIIKKNTTIGPRD